MCDIWKKKNVNEMSTEEIKTAFDDNLLRKLKVIRISCGEPFMRPDLKEILLYLYNAINPSYMHITTNGYLTKRIVNCVKDIVKKDFNLHVKLSIDSPNTLHDKIRGVSGAYEQAIKTLKKLIAIRNKHNFYLGINQVITKENVKEIIPMQKLGKKYNVDIVQTLAYSAPPAYKNESLGNPKYTTFSDFSKRELREIFDLIKREEKYSFLSGEWIQDMINRYHAYGLKNRLLDSNDYPNPSCMELFSQVRIMPVGDVVTCLYNAKSIGNLRKQSFSDIWTSEKMRKARDFVIRCPSCWAGCEVVPNAVFSGDLFKIILSGKLK